MKLSMINHNAKPLPVLADHFCLWSSTLSKCLRSPIFILDRAQFFLLHRSVSLCVSVGTALIFFFISKPLLTPSEANNPLAPDYAGPTRWSPRSRSFIQFYACGVHLCIVRKKERGLPKSTRCIR